MAQRVFRVNELLKREISDILHTRFQAETIAITILEVDAAPDLREARVFYNAFGNENNKIAAAHFFTRYHGEIRRLLGRRIVFKYLPHLFFVLDESTERGMRINQLLDNLGLTGEQPPGPPSL